MKKTPVYCALIEIQPLEGCELDPIENAGAAVRCYIPAHDATSAIKFLVAELIGMKMRLVETEWCVDHDETEWDNPKDEEGDACVQKARDSGDIVFDTFHTWGHDAPDAG